MIHAPGAPGIARVRFAPSPTGNLHLGGARTALFNWLFARRNRGLFVLRIEDTDRERSSGEYTGEILDSLQWLGLCWDEGPFFQSRRLDRYQASAAELLERGLAYRCFCSPEELDREREAVTAQGGTYRYDGRCSRLSSDEAEKRRAAGMPHALRIRVEPGSAAWDDLVRGPIEVDHRELDDFVIVKGDGHPTYHFAVVVDDIDMAITHVIRGDDHISNTPKHIVLYHALGAAPPVMAHIPLIHGSDGKRLSKRHGATAVLDYRRMGILPEALVNYLALLGWSPGDDREIMTPQEMVAAFDIERVVKNPAVFDLEKLRWMNGQYLARLSPSFRTEFAIPVWIEAGLLKPGDAERDRSRLEGIVEAVGDRIKVLPEIIPLTDFFFREPAAPDEKAAAVLRKAAADRAHFVELFEMLGQIEDWRRSEIEAVIRGFMSLRSLGNNRVIQPLRAAISGKLVTPGLFECLELLGREAVLWRMRENLLTIPAVPDAS